MLIRQLSGFRPALCAVALLSLFSTPHFAGPERSALAGKLGLYDGKAFALTKGECPDNCQTSPQSLWYFKGDTVAVPRADGVQFDPTARALQDVRNWAKQRQGKPEGRLPGLLWVGSSASLSGKLSADGKSLSTAEGAVVPFALVPKIQTNLSFYNEASTQFFGNKAVTARGEMVNGQFVARTLWPEDFSLTQLPAMQPLAPNESVAGLIRADKGGAAAAFQARVLWQRDAKAPLSLAGKPALAFVLNGAQGDDDEAHGGHFAVATGEFGERGEWGHWLTNNFYNLGSVSEKGIIASTVPMDAYMGDLNSGQAWYRPSYVMVAVLKDKAAPALYQEAIGRVFQHFYRQDFRYHHAAANCTGLNVETLRALGWKLPRQGAEGRVKAWAALPYMAAKDLDWSSGQKAYDYLATERTDLYPFVGFEAVSSDLLTRIATGKADKAGLEAQLAEDLEAVIFMRVPQFPSSRAFGQAPIASLDEYMARVPENKADWKIVPVDARPFPDSLKDSQAPREAYRGSWYASWVEGLLALSLAGWAVRRYMKRRAARKA